ncbi:MAG: hypothetical protein Q8L55_13350 [Phycisphaerales bacterium]|nr:hypothetical protein [Phycisphaerales bacterium]
MTFEYTVDADNILAYYVQSQQLDEVGRAESRALFRKGLKHLAIGIGLLLVCVGLWVVDRLGLAGLGVGLAVFLLPAAGVFTFIGVALSSTLRRQANGTTKVSRHVVRAMTSESQLARRTGLVRATLNDAGLTTELNGEVHVIGPRAVARVSETEGYLFVQSRSWWIVAIPRKQVGDEVIRELKRVVGGWGTWNDGAGR